MKRLLAALLPLALLCASPALAATLAASPAAFGNALTASKSGDAIELSSGDYGDLPAWGQAKASPGVTIRPAVGAVVMLSSINASGSTNLTFTGLDVTMKPTTQYGLAVGGGGQGVVFDHMKVHQADGSSLAGVGFFIRNAGGVTIQNSEFYWSGIGGTVMDSDSITIAGNLIHDVNVDGIDLAGTTNTLVTRNTIHDSHPGVGDHPDGIQFWSTATTATNQLGISFNRIERGAGGIIQGIFGEDGSNVSIQDNELLGTMYNGIGLARTKGAMIHHNFVDGYPDMDTRIIVRGGCDQVWIAENAAQAVVNYVTTTEPPCTNVTIADNTSLQPAAMGDYSLLNAWKGTPAPVPAPAPTPAPSPAPTPTPNPLQATVDALNAQVASLTAQVADLTAKLAAAQAATTAAQGQVSTLTAQLAAVQSQLTTCQAQLKAATTKITKGRAALK